MARLALVATLAALALAAPAPAATFLGGCPVFPTTNAWNRDVSRLPVVGDGRLVGMTACPWRVGGRRRCLGWLSSAAAGLVAG